MTEKLNLTPLFRSFIGLEDLQSQLLNAIQQNNNHKFPPYNIESLGDDSNYTITMAVAGYTTDELDIELNDRKLTITGTKSDDAGGSDRKFIHKGISARSFKQDFQLAEFIEVKKVSLEHGMLKIDLVKQVPEDKQPLKIAINT